MKEHQKSLGKSLILLLFILIGIGAVGLALHNAFFCPAPSIIAAEQLAAPLAPNDVQGLIARVSSLVVVPSDTPPTVASVQDVTLLQQQNPVFYRDAQNGDRVLAWPTEVVLYSSTKNKVLVAMPVTVVAAPAQTTSTRDLPATP